MAGGAAKASAAPAELAEESTVSATTPLSNGAVALADFDYSEDAGAGFEGLDSSEMLVPFVRILQALSPVCVEGSQSYDPDLRPGMIIHTATGEAYPKELGAGFIMCARDASYTEWVPIQPGVGTAGGGGFRGTWAHDDPRVARMIAEQGAFRKLQTAEGTELVETRTLYGLIVPRAPDGSWIRELATNGVISFSSTQLKKYRLIVTRLQSLAQGKMKLVNGKALTPPSFAWRWNLTTQPEKNKFGSYYGWRLSLAEATGDASMLKVNDELYHMAKALHDLVKRGMARADFASGDRAPDMQSGAAGDHPNIDEEIPF